MIVFLLNKMFDCGWVKWVKKSFVVSVNFIRFINVLMEVMMLVVIFVGLIVLYFIVVKVWILKKKVIKKLFVGELVGFVLDKYFRLIVR